MDPLTQPNILNSLPKIHPDHHKSKIIWLVVGAIGIVLIIIVLLNVIKKEPAPTGGPLSEAQRAEILKNLQNGTTASDAKPLTQAQRAELLDSLDQSTTGGTQSKPLTQAERDQILKDLSN